MPPLDDVKNVRQKADKFFKIKNNDNGVFNKPKHKIRYMCKKFIENNGEIHNDTFIIKLAGDGTSVTKSGVNLLNFAFTIINDTVNAKSVNGNYILGK